MSPRSQPFQVTVMKALAFATVAALATTIAAADRPQQNQDNFEHRGASQITITVASLACSTDAGAGEFDVRSWSWGAMNSASVSTGSGGGSGKASIGNLMIKKAFDTCSPLLLAAVTSGRHFQTLRLEQTDYNGNVVATVNLTDVIVTAWNVGSSTRDADPDEAATFAFRKVCLQAGATQSCFDGATAATT
jgi:type VI secretion system secreted protein Hcp